MLNQSSFKSGIKSKAAITALFIAGFLFSGQAQEDNQPSAVMNYGENHPYVFIGAIVVGVLIAVFAVYFLFMRPSKEKATATNFQKPVINPNSRNVSDRDRRYGGKRTVSPSGGFTRK